MNTSTSNSERATVPIFSWRSVLCVVIVGIVPLTIANLIGVSVPDQYSPERFDWEHGWPLRYCYRSRHLLTLAQWGGSPLPPPLVFDGRTWNVFSRFEDESVLAAFNAHAKIEIDARRGVSSRWPFDRAEVTVDIYHHLWLIGLVAVAIIVGVSVAARRAALVVRGVPQFSLRTLLIIVALTALTATMHFRLHLWCWESWIALPALTTAVVGYSDLVGSLYKRVIMNRTENRTVAMRSGQSG